MFKPISIKYKNLLATGNNWIEIAFNDAKTILATGSNGSGKSSILSALVFCLYGKDFRGIKKGGLINSINKKNLVTECVFEVGGSTYKVIRGIKPDIFDIYKNDVLLPNDNKKDQQKTLDSIIRFPYDSFKQIVATGSGQYIPFMKLKALQRREFIDNFLEIDTFSKMKVSLKDKNDKISERIKDQKRDAEIFSEKIKFIKNMRETKSGEDLAKRMDYVHNIKNLSKEIDELNAKRVKAVSSLGESNAKMDKIHTVENAVSTLKFNISNLNNNTGKLRNKFSSIETITNCPTCLQGIDDGHKDKIRCETDSEIEKVNLEIVPLNEKLEKLNKFLNNKAEISKEVSNWNTVISTIDNRISAKNSSINHFNELIDELNDDTIQNTDDLDEIQNALTELNDSLLKNQETKAMYDYASLLLKDDGIKSVIVKKYVDVLNQLVNGYLAKFDFYINFVFDENFNETIKSRHRDEFSYENFSEGEKARIDLSILFAFRSMAKMRSNLDCSLLIIDELLDSAIDANGIDDLRAIFEMFEDMNIFIISHREKASELFSKTLEFKKVGNFSQMEVVG